MNRLSRAKRALGEIASILAHDLADALTDNLVKRLQVKNAELASTVLRLEDDNFRLQTLYDRSTNEPLLYADERTAILRAHDSLYDTGEIFSADLLQRLLDRSVFSQLSTAQAELDMDRMNSSISTVFEW